MSNRNFSASGSAKLAIAVSLLAFASLVTMLRNADDAFVNGYRSALSDEQNVVGKTFASNAPSYSKAAHIQSAASEDYWLGHAGRINAVPVAWTRALEIGDTVTISTKQGNRKLKVEGIAEMPANTHTASGVVVNPRLFIVTARESGRPDGFVLRMLIEDAKGAILNRSKSVSDRNL